MKKYAVVVLFVSAGIVPASCAQKNSDCADTRECPGAVDAGQDAPSPPLDCNPEGVCPNDGTGIFVSPNGSDTNDGAKDRPFKSFARALGRRPNDAGTDAGPADAGASDGGNDAGALAVRIYACEGTYAEDAPLEGDLEVYGGFSCADWKFTGAHAIVVSVLPLRLRGGKASFSDIEFRASASTKRGASSIAGFVVDSTVELHRTTFVAAAGSPGEDSVDAAPFNPASAPNSTGGFDDANPLCRTSIGGAGGRCDRGAGTSGSPIYPQPAPGWHTGAGGVAGGICGSSGDGMPGSDGIGGQIGKDSGRFGILSADGWRPESGAAGLPGTPGQGGGGGVGPDTGCSGSTPPGCCSEPGGCFCPQGGAGAPGGCGGAPGKGGGAGGSSIALALVRSRVTIEASRFVADTGADGGKGAAGGRGQDGGKFASNYTCAGGIGGPGGGGGGGAGGPGGLSVAVLWIGTAPTIDGQAVQSATTFPGMTVATAVARGGPPGAGGEPGSVNGGPRARGQTAGAGRPGLTKPVVGLEADGTVIQ